MASFLLQCNICPKHPNFSDLSHLLTHVGSKGHLSHYFKAQVRSRQEPAVREELRAYDHWYQVNQVERLLSQRMILKDSKNAQNKSRVTDKPLLQQRPKNTARRDLGAEPRATQQQAPQKEENVLDPQLTSEAFSGPQASAIPKAQIPAFDPASASREYVPRMQGSNSRNQISQALSPTTTPETGSSSRSARVRLPHTANKTAEADTRSKSSTGHIYPEPPVFPQLFDAFANDNPRPTTAGRAAIRAASHQSDAEVEEIEELDDIISGCTKLKGICWPGMDIFDSASLEARRKRNQKKDGSILEQMKANSAVVEPTELIFYSGGELKKRRHITGQVDSSPIKEESPQPKRQRTRSRKAPLSSVCTNGSRSGRKLHFVKSASTNIKQTPKVFQELPNQSFALDDSLPLRKPCAKHRQPRTQTDEDLDWALLIGDTHHVKRKAFEVHNDEPEKQQGPSHARDHNQSPTTSYPFLHDKHNTTQVYPPPHGLPYPSTGYGFPHLAMTSPANNIAEAVHQKNVGTRFVGNRNLFGFNTTDNKENIEPIMDEAGRIDNAVASFGNGRSTQRYFAMQGNGPAHYYTSTPPHLDFAAPQPRQPHGYSVNPLALSFGQPSALPMPYNLWPKVRSATRATRSSRSVSGATGMTPGLVEDSGDETIDEEAEHDSMLQNEEDD